MVNPRLHQTISLVYYLIVKATAFTPIFSFYLTYHPIILVYLSISLAFALQLDEDFASDVNKAIDTITDTWQKQQLQNALNQHFLFMMSFD